MADIDIAVTQNTVQLAVNGLASITAGTGVLGNGSPGTTIVGAGTLAVDLAPDGAGTANQVPRATDSRLSNARTPTAHAASHALLGSDPISIGIAQVGGLSTVLADKVDNTTTVTAGTGLTGGGALSTSVTLNVDLAPSGGGIATQAVSATDSRLSNARTPTSHGGTHGSAGTDPIPAGALAQSQVANLTTDLAGKVPTTRNVTAGTGLTGGGNLSSDITLACDFAASGSATVGKPVEATDTRLSNSRAPTGAAGGDLAGTYPNPTVDGIAGFAVDTATPTIGDVWVYSGSQWNHQAQSTLSTPPSGAASGDLAGTYPSPTVDGLAGQPIDVTAPAAGDGWLYSGSQWNHTALVDIQAFTTAGTSTWTKPTGCKVVRMICIGGGGGGGSGHAHASGTRAGGGGGGGGAISEITYRASDLPATLTVVVGTGGAGGAGVTANANGNPGSAGTLSRIGPTTAPYCQAAAGAGGLGGTNSGGSGGAGSTSGLYPGGAGGTGGTGTAPTAAVDSTGAPGGGGGGGISGGGSATVGAAGGRRFGIGTVATSLSGINATAIGIYGSGAGGSDGGGTALNVGGNGIYGSGGGGSGGSATQSAAGGTGGAGLVLIISEY
jgi:hypothetical protein